MHRTQKHPSCFKHSTKTPFGQGSRTMGSELQFSYALQVMTFEAVIWTHLIRKRLASMQCKGGCGQGCASNSHPLVVNMNRIFFYCTSLKMTTFSMHLSQVKVESGAITHGLFHHYFESFFKTYKD